MRDDDVSSIFRKLKFLVPILLTVICIIVAVIIRHENQQNKIVLNNIETEFGETLLNDLNYSRFDNSIVKGDLALAQIELHQDDNNFSIFVKTKETEFYTTNNCYHPLNNGDIDIVSLCSPDERVIKIHLGNGRDYIDQEAEFYSTIHKDKKGIVRMIIFEEK